MITMVPLSYINPLSNEGKNIVRKYGSLDSISQPNSDLIEVITHTPHQDQSDDKIIPKNIMELSLKRIEWYIRKNRDRDYDNKHYAYLFNEKIATYDVIAFYLLVQAVAVKYGPHSREGRLIIESQGKIIENRLEKLLPSKRKDIIKQILEHLLGQGKLNWIKIKDLISSRKINLQDLILDKGNIIWRKEDFLNTFSSKIKDRDPQKIYELLIGEHLKQLLLIKIIMQKTEDYMVEVHKKSEREIEPNPILIQLSEEISKKLLEPISTPKYVTKTGGVIKASTLNPQLFPPCVVNAMEGIKSGGRNDAIVLFITPFISYARLYPSVFRENVTKKITELDPDLIITQEEILPLIYQAADKCIPPLFEDQPQEKININAKLGFGMHEKLDLKHEGESKWYTPMSCEKIKLHLPSLCRPDQTCKKIGNPLSYYNRRSWEQIKKKSHTNHQKNSEGGD